MTNEMGETDAGVWAELNKGAVSLRRTPPSPEIIPKKLDSAILELGLSRGMLSFSLTQIMCKC